MPYGTIKQDASLEDYAALIQQSSFKKKAQDLMEQKEKPSLFKRIVSVLSTGETGQAAYDMLEGKNPVLSYGQSINRSIRGLGFEKKTYSDVLEKLGMKRTYLSELAPDLYNETGEGLFKFKKGGFLDPSNTGTVGLVLDIALDPTTYLGGAGLFKRIGKNGIENLTEAGVKLVKATDEQILSKATKKGLEGENFLKFVSEETDKVRQLIMDDPNKYFKGITFAGNEIIARKYVSNAGTFIDETMSHIPILNSVYEGVKGGIQDAFKYGATAYKKAEEAGAGLWGENTVRKVLNLEKVHNRTVETNTSLLFNDLFDFNNNVIKKSVDKLDRESVDKYITDTIEANMGVFGVKTDQKLVDSIVDRFKKYNEGFYKDTKNAEKALNIDILNEVANYMPHIASEDGMKALKNKNLGKFRAQFMGEYSTSSQKGRKLYHFVDEAGNKITGTADSLGLKENKRNTVERYLTEKANKLIKTREKSIKKLETLANNLEKKALKASLKDVTEELPTKIAKLKIEPKGLKGKTLLSETTENGRKLWRETIKSKDSYQLLTAELKNNETARFVEALFNAPKSEVEKLKKRIANIKDKKISKLLDEITNIKDNLDTTINELPDSFRWWEKKSGNNVVKYTIDRPLSISEANEYMKPFMEKAGMGDKKFFETDPLQLTYRRGIKAIRDIQRMDFIRGVVDLGSEKGVELDGSVYKSVTKEMTNADGTTDLVRFIDPQMKEIPRGVLLPDFVVAELKKAKGILDDDNVISDLLKSYDKLHSKWKGLVYGWFPQSHGRNLIGGQFVNLIANKKSLKFINSVKDILKGGDKKIILNGKEYPVQVLKKIVAGSGMLSQRGSLDINDLTRSFNPKFFDKVSGVPIKASEFVEAYNRIPLFLAELDSGNTIQGAINTVYKYHFDYTPANLTEFERNIARRIIPFYTWTRNNVPLMIEELISNPSKITPMFKMARNITDEEGNEMLDLLPSYQGADLTAIRGGEEMSNFGLPPVEMIKFMTNPLKAISSSITPFGKVPVELATNYSFFRDKAISEDTSGEFAKNYPDVVKKYLEYEEIQVKPKNGNAYTMYRVDPMKKYWLYATPASRWVSLVTPKSMPDEEKNEILRSLTSIKTLDRDKQKLQEISDNVYKKKLLEILEQSGVINKYGTLNPQYKNK